MATATANAFSPRWHVPGVARCSPMRWRPGRLRSGQCSRRARSPTSCLLPGWTQETRLHRPPDPPRPDRAHGQDPGCRALLLLHDAQGHPLFATTHRGDLHLTKGRLPSWSATSRRQDQPRWRDSSSTAKGWRGVPGGVRGQRARRRHYPGSTQYQGRYSFTEVGAFVPLCWDRHGEVTREVASAKFACRYLTIQGSSCALRWP